MKGSGGGVKWPVRRICGFASDVTGDWEAGEGENQFREKKERFWVSLHRGKKGRERTREGSQTNGVCKPWNEEDRGENLLSWTERETAILGTFARMGKTRRRGERTNVCVAG